MTSSSSLSPEQQQFQNLKSLWKICYGTQISLVTFLPNIQAFCSLPNPKAAPISWAYHLAAYILPLFECYVIHHKISGLKQHSLFSSWFHESIVRAWFLAQGLQSHIPGVTWPVVLDFLDSHLQFGVMFIRGTQFLATVGQRPSFSIGCPFSQAIYSLTLISPSSSREYLVKAVTD